MLVILPCKSQKPTVCRHASNQVPSPRHRTVSAYRTSAAHMLLVGEWRGRKGGTDQVSLLEPPALLPLNNATCKAGSQRPLQSPALCTQLPLKEQPPAPPGGEWRGGHGAH